MIAMLSPYSPFAVLSYVLSFDFSDSLILRGQNTSCVFQQQEAGVTPKPEGIGPRFCGAMGSLPPLIVFWPCSVSLPSLSHLPALSTSYLHARVTPKVKSPEKDASSEPFTAMFTG
jgi:hypothetical protein